MNYIPLTQEQKEIIRQENGLNFNGEKISFFLDGKEVATTDLLEGSTRDARFLAAEMIGIRGFNDYHIIRKDGQILKASDIRGIHITDSDTDFGTDQGFAYHKFLHRHEQDQMWSEIKEIIFKGEFDNDIEFSNWIEILKQKYTVRKK